MVKDSAQATKNAADLPTTGADAVEILINDHHVIKSLLDQLTSAKNGTRKATLERLKGVLTIHNATEENLVYPALAVVAGKKTESDHLYKETAQADVGVFEVDMLLKEHDDAGFLERAKKLQMAILEHIDDEEKKAFPDLKKHADAKQSAQLTKDVREFRDKIHLA